MLQIVMVSSPRLLPDEMLLAACRVEHFRGSGPGGQKRNKTSNAVRITHRPSGVAGAATESRSTKENMLWAIRRLRIHLAADLREPIDLSSFEPPPWFVSVRQQRRLSLSHRHPLYAATAGLMLDLLKACGAKPAAVAINLGITTTATIKLLQSESAWWMAANRIRADVALEPLSSRR